MTDEYMGTVHPDERLEFEERDAYRILGRMTLLAECRAKFTDDHLRRVKILIWNKAYPEFPTEQDFMLQELEWDLCETLRRVKTGAKASRPRKGILLFFRILKEKVIL